MRRAMFFGIFICIFTWGVALAADTPPIKVGFVFVSPIGDAGWSYAHDQGRLSIEAMDGVTTSLLSLKGRIPSVSCSIWPERITT